MKKEIKQYVSQVGSTAELFEKAVQAVVSDAPAGDGANKSLSNLQGVAEITTEIPQDSLIAYKKDNSTLGYGILASGGGGGGVSQEYVDSKDALKRDKATPPATSLPLPADTIEGNTSNGEVKFKIEDVLKLVPEADLGNYYTKSEVDNSQNSQNSITQAIDGRVVVLENFKIQQNTINQNLQTQIDEKADTVYVDGELVKKRDKATPTENLAPAGSFLEGTKSDGTSFKTPASQFGGGGGSGGVILPYTKGIARLQQLFGTPQTVANGVVKEVAPLLLAPFTLNEIHGTSETLPPKLLKRDSDSSPTAFIVESAFLPDKYYPLTITLRLQGFFTGATGQFKNIQARLRRKSDGAEIGLLSQSIFDQTFENCQFNFISYAKNTSTTTLDPFFVDGFTLEYFHNNGSSVYLNIDGVYVIVQLS